MKVILLVGALLLVGCCLPPRTLAATEAGTTAEITALLREQSAAWNRGDIDGFMAGYERNDSLRFASDGSVTRGWKATLDGYRSRYPDKSAMGTLTFTELEITELAPHAAIAFGRWKLTRDHDAPQGIFTLTLRKTAAGWRIVQDHTSSAR